MIEKRQTEIDAINVTIKMHSASCLQNAFHLFLHFALITLYENEFQRTSCLHHGTGVDDNCSDLNRFQRCIRCRNCTQKLAASSCPFTNGSNCSRAVVITASNLFLQSQMQNSDVKMCEKSRYENYLISLRPRAAQAIWLCLYVHCEQKRRKKANRYFVQTKRPCRSLFNFVPHYFQRLFIFSSIQAETTINVCIIAYLHINYYLIF